MRALGGGDRKVAASYSAIWAIDFEFRGDPGDNPTPVCFVGRDILSGREIRLWQDELRMLRSAPFDVGPSSIVSCYFASAEASCFLALGWPMPTNFLDLYAEHRVQTNGLATPGNGLVGALAWHGLGHMDAGEKESMRRLILDQAEWSPDERKAILEYCATDVAAVEALFHKMMGDIDLPRALMRGRYSGPAVARMIRNGIPIDTRNLGRLVRYGKAMKGFLVAEIDRAYGVYEGLTFRTKAFEELLTRWGVQWPRHPTGALNLDDDAFKMMSRIYPQFEQLRFLRQLMGELRLGKLEVGRDGRNRSLLSQLRAITGRNQPSTSRFIFGAAKPLRSLIKPEEGMGLAYIDFASQEIAIAAALSGDELMMQGYIEGDPYLAFAKQARLVPDDATRETHKAIRDRCKALVLGINYGMGIRNLALNAGISEPEAATLLRAHKRTYRTFWNWVEGSTTTAMLTSEMESVFGWKRQITAGDKATSIMNFPMQANGAEMMRAAAIAGTEAGIEVCAPVHDAFLISAPLHELDARVAEMSELMSRAGSVITGGFPVRTTAQLFRYPDHFVEERGGELWQIVLRIIGELERAAT